MSNKVVIANDHGAIELKDRLVKHLEGRGYTVNDLGIQEGETADYPDQGAAASREFLKGGYTFGIVLCGTGLGISMSANKVDGIRCALPQNIFAAQMSKEHNNANILAFGGRIDYADSPESMVDAYIDAEFGGERHERRVNKIMEIEGTDS